MGQAKKRGSFNDRRNAVISQGKDRKILRLAKFADDEILLARKKPPQELFEWFRKNPYYINGKTALQEAMSLGLTALASRIQYQLKRPFSAALRRDFFLELDAENSKQKAMFSVMNIVANTALDKGMEIRTTLRDTFSGGREGETLFFHERPVIFVANDLIDICFMVVILHEIIHATGPAMGRWGASEQPAVGIDGTLGEEYAFEECVAEFGERMLLGFIGFPRNNYLTNAMDLLERVYPGADKEKAFKEAEKAFAYIVG